MHFHVVAYRLSPDSRTRTSRLWQTFEVTIRDKAFNARALVLHRNFGVLSTISLDVPGYPFGSVTPYCVDQSGHLILYISHIAQHTRNIAADPRLSLTVVDEDAGSADQQARGRVTYIANGSRIQDEADLSAAASRYFRYFPSSRQYERTHDFSFFRLEPVRIRFIGGFGEIYWIEPADFVVKNPFSPAQEVQIVEHMNRDHADALKHYCRGVEAVMAGIDSEGFDVLAAGRRVRFDFDAPIHNMNEARQALVAMAKQDRPGS